MKRPRRRAAVLMATLASAAVVLAGPAPLAAASPQQICGNYGSGYCINDWNNEGYGYPPLMYYGNSSNEDFWPQLINRCNGGHKVLSATAGDPMSCPDFGSEALNQQLRGDNIIQLHYGNTGLCLAENGNSGLGMMGTCNSPGNGTGGSAGTVQIVHDTYTLINLKHTQSDGAGFYVCVGSGGNPQQPVHMDDHACGTFWGGL